ncbi:caspase family protein [Desulfobacterales bacterium HSG17]|nr:caspase family protein [Desulfobacterales bacterium HSG17]
MKAQKYILIICLLYLFTAFSPLSAIANCISGECSNGFGAYKWPDNNMYEGEWKDEVRSGKGTMTWNNGNQYKGQWLNNSMHGTGIMTWADGNVYEGEWQHDLMHGTGTRKWTNGNVYTGDWDKNIRTGKGAFSWNNGDTYKGEWLNSAMNGQGKMTWAGGDTYEGVWKNNMMQGTGTKKWINGNEYRGEWKNNVRSGQGVLSWNNGDKYEGEWSSDQINGYGTMTWAKGNKYTGLWKNGTHVKKLAKLPEKKLDSQQQNIFIMAKKEEKKIIPEQINQEQINQEQINQEQANQKQREIKTQVDYEKKSQKINKIKKQSQPQKIILEKKNKIPALKPNRKIEKKQHPITTASVKREKIVSQSVTPFVDRGIKLNKKRVWKQKRMALVIGNGDYKDSPLRNPPNDAKDMAKALKEYGFNVDTLINATQREMKKAVSKFGKKLKQGGAGLFYYAGHGMQVSGRNYLIPVNAVIESESDVEYESVDAGRILGKMEDAGNDLNIVILDACRNNPFARSFRSGSQGLSRMDAPKGTMIVYATAPDSVAADGADKNGVFTKYLLKYMEAPGVPVEKVLKSVRMDVLKATGDQQVPWESSSLTGDFYFNPVQRNNTSLMADSGAVFQTRPSAESAGIILSTLTVRASVLGAEVWFNGKNMGKAPLKIRNIKAGKYSIKVSAGGYEDYDKNIKIESGISQEISAFLDKEVLAAAESKEGAFQNNRDGRFIANGDGTVLDTATGLMWAEKDNGEDIDWKKAKEYCNNFQGAGYTDWRMPTLDELEQIYEKDKKNKHGYHVTKLIGITACCPWQSETKGANVTNFNFFTGYKLSGPKSYSYSGRALPVRRSE